MEANWTVASGSLRNSITLQSSLDDDDDDEHNPSKSIPLLLQSPSSDSPPCEITINFGEKRELRQVYVRSTARVYEIYCAPNREYLCTVHCGVAVRDGRVLPVQDPTEDDWVEVKVVDTPNPILKTSQDLHEATAEIDDADPCISVTLRLLSLQNKGCVYVDEIYVFADPVDSADSESRNENTSGGSLMAMLLPTVMQLSKTAGLGHLSALRKEKQLDSEYGLGATHPSHPVVKTQLQGKGSIEYSQELKLNEVKESWVGPSHPDLPLQVAKMESNQAALPSLAAKADNTCSFVPSKITEMENNHRAAPFQIDKTECHHSAAPSQVMISESNHGNSLGGNVERALEQLVSRMDRIEEICLGFQEKMVMPMSSIETRLQRVEQQLDALTKKLQNSAVPSCSRISAPDASCIESDVNSSDNCLDPTITRESESDKKHLDAEVPYVSDDMSGSANTTQLLPGLVVTAPEFPDGEDEDVNASGQEIASSKDIGKRSIDDALSSALANLLSSSTTIECPKYTKSLTVKAPEFSNEDDDDHGGNSEIVKNDLVYLPDNEEISDIQVLASPNISVESGERVNTDSNSEKTAQEAEKYGQFCRAEGDQDEVNIEANILAEDNPRAGFTDKSEDDKNGNINGQKSVGLSSNISDISKELLDNQNSCGQEGTSARTELTVATEVPRKTFHENIIENVLGFSLASSVVDFETPILDVKFISQRSPVTGHFLEDLLVETQVTTSSSDLSVKESNDLTSKEPLNSNADLPAEGKSNLISIEDGELVTPTSDSHFVADKDLCSSITAPVNIQGDNMPSPEDHKRKRDQISS
ncbi:hypothetical protein RJT34_31478 [Clitoria ternatea]|uniref:Uncharacterized protein n=1 Tax=Clitoria ternatea TaxID=43366 RepID=A0AAN9EUD8_CLITE